MTTNQAVAKEDQVGLAIMAMVFTDLTLSIADAIIKVTVSDMPLLQFILLRCGITVPLLVLILGLRYPQVSLRPVFPAWAILRSSMLLISLLLYYASLPRLDFSTAAAVYYTIPLFTTLFAAVWIREPVGVQGWTGVGIGFGGVLLMLKPQAGDLNIFALLPLTSAMLYALGVVVTRTKCRGEHPLVLALTFNLTAIGLSGAVTCIAGFGDTAGALDASRFLGEWIAMGWFQWGLVMLLSMMMLIGSVGTAIAYQLGPPSVISTWDFSYLAFAVLWGVVLFSEHLDAASMLGIALIALAGIIATGRRPAPLH
ncbi:DMT family transporter [Mesorhizobium sp.]|uniref:DMT family transporter n=1 Tax=Mesorhizobium TaxID=68287 RepID=UPI000FE415DC|nr:DMT family transporter [Mesorhizobium sp.]RWG50487.1 MAG: DMT family transporter [Mesorhizobium sp.]RWL05245.1 MAG: DMT family transporter [Mesorhizobium sp.]RWO40182.1 MAG: DMT family transporter [Mesorhizobium sp.]TIN10268.1 MAG: DMT family transporter [Mesorhizobium sp.]TIN23056.1 MAG: DMT family transporter [Mesorhizobium sp.]